MKPCTGGPSSSPCNSVHKMVGKMDELIDETVKDGKERLLRWSFMETYDIDELIEDHIIPYESDTATRITRIESPITGEESRVVIPETEPGEKQIFYTAYFHTHPGNDPRFSNADYAYTLHNNIQLSCLGTADDEGNHNISCDSMPLVHSTYKHRREIEDRYINECRPAETNIARAIEKGHSSERINELHSKYVSARNNMLFDVKNAIGAGAINRCSYETNFSKV